MAGPACLLLIAALVLISLHSRTSVLTCKGHWIGDTDWLPATETAHVVLKLNHPWVLWSHGSVEVETEQFQVSVYEAAVTRVDDGSVAIFSPIADDSTTPVGSYDPTSMAFNYRFTDDAAFAGECEDAG